jgi:hypothetical protein
VPVLREAVGRRPAVPRGEHEPAVLPAVAAGRPDDGAAGRPGEPLADGEPTASRSTASRVSPSSPPRRSPSTIARRCSADSRPARPCAFALGPAALGPAHSGCAAPRAGSLPAVRLGGEYRSMSPPTTADRVLELLRDAHQPLDDDEPARQLDVSPRQTINQMCRRLQLDGHVRRVDGPTARSSISSSSERSPAPGSSSGPSKRSSRDQ